ncbi:hypothetical protein Pcinc_027099 [Petrolisthes cinctipes]|uniref:Uncharacterized protein n=1 Tax=Petrolisthes cinctipes TaxID=88211 RepID=A0AAE1K779_PETCI|nr:hypothetical protein Pcinc_027099 [Petrolisthes cinctipes]
MEPAHTSLLSSVQQLFQTASRTPLIEVTLLGAPIKPDCINELQGIDTMLCETISRCCNVQLSDDAWTQASLPLRLGGIGTQRMADVALPAYISSMDATSELHPHHCKCGRMTDKFGHHSLSCCHDPGRLPHHAALNDVVTQGLAAAGITAILEPQATHLLDCSINPGTAARSPEARKRHKYAALSQLYDFVPLVVETTGFLGQDFTHLIQDLVDASRKKLVNPMRPLGSVSESALLWSLACIF